MEAITGYVYEKIQLLSATSRGGTIHTNTHPLLHIRGCYFLHRASLQSLQTASHNLLILILTTTNTTTLHLRINSTTGPILHDTRW